VKPEAIKRAGVINLGSSSARLIIGERQGAEVKVLESLRSVLPIGNDTFTSGVIAPETTRQVLEILERYTRLLKEYDVSETQVFATTAVREAENREIFLDVVRRKTGLEVEVFTPGDVVYYIVSYLYHRFRRRLPVEEKNLLVAELGAGTADFSLLRRGAIVRITGLPLGTMRINQLLTEVSSGSGLVALRDYVAYELSQLRQSLPRIGVDGVILLSESLAYGLPPVLGRERLQGKLHTLSRTDAQEFARRCIGKPPDELVHDYRIPGDVAETLGGLAAIVETLFAVFQQPSAFVVETTLHEAVLTHRLQHPAELEQADKLRQLVSMARSLLHKYNADLRHAQQVARLARSLFTGLRTALALEPHDLSYLLLAAYLHDIGKFISASGHHRHSEYLIGSLHLFRLSEEELKVIACIARHHRRAAPSPDFALYRSLRPAHRLLVQKLTALLRIADALDRSHVQKVGQVEAKLDDSGGITVIAECPEDAVLERISFQDKKRLLEAITGCGVRLEAKGHVGS
jgi:exopolyphosphatase/guanosine-5'-triphosphate,3'-diphosphate pyrophosphatase